MKGNNELRLNEATLIEAMQEYLNKRMTVFSPKVHRVCMDGREFVVHVQEEKPVSADGK